MQQKDIEKLAFLFLCGKRDKDILTGTENMSFSDFERLTYMMDLLGLDAYNLETIKEYYRQFEEQFCNLERIKQEESSDVEYEPSGIDMEQCDKWIEEFCSHVPDKRIRKWIEDQIKDKCKN